LAASRVIQSLRLRAADAVDAMLGPREPLVPPRRLLGFVGDSDFRATGEEFLDHLHRFGGLRATDRVLDVGCGIGRIARVLAPELRAPGSYDGFDIAADAISWCSSHYLDTTAPFRFQHADLQNSMYNPLGVGSATDYRFPFRDASFDLVLAISVFTHLLADAAENYLAEAARVLAPGGRLFTTWFLLDPDRSTPRDRAAFDFSDPAGPASVSDREVPEAAVAFNDRWLEQRFQAHGLTLREPIRRGSWRGAPGTSFQDIVVAGRDGSARRGA
jgi:SAM-dependent methyltransferase